ncbi:MAG TPA: SAM-dependent methyltransferase [Chitinophagaceae bacterium]|nr:SAM-dependent methyltransferase [Chitinophagaceae bacterium]
MAFSTVYLIPTVLYEGETGCLPAYILETIKKCTVLFIENERTARRFLKLLSKEIVIDDFEWFNIEKISSETEAAFKQKIKENKTIGIISEAGCPGIADPGQRLVEIAQELNVIVKPLVGPNSILLALMASGMNGQKFQFVGYLPIDIAERIKAIKTLENESKQKNCTQIFIETPYRNNQLLETILKTCHPQTRLCIGVDLTSPKEFIKTMRVNEWKNKMTDIHKRPAIFLLHAQA